MLETDWLHLCEQHNLGHFISVSQVHGGDSHRSWCLTSSQGRLFVKTSPRNRQEVFLCEADSLNALSQANSLRCPVVIAQGSTPKTAWLMLQWLELGGPRHAERLGQQLAQLHQHTGQSFGWHQHNYIGNTPQHNNLIDDWVSFYRSQRLLPQLKWARDRGLPHPTTLLGDQLLDRLDEWFCDYTPVASLLHGDLWSGNAAYLSDGSPVVFDPACHYGDRETDIAMTELFGGFEPAFYDAYQSVWPLDAGYERRRPLYQLYHVLNHFNLFGGGYARQAGQLLNHLLSSQ